MRCTRTFRSSTITCRNLLLLRTDAFAAWGDFLTLRYRPITVDDPTPTLTVTYHDACAGLRELGVKAQPRALLARVSGVALTEMSQAEQCCGFGGTFAVKFGEISSHIAERKCADIEATRADAVVLGDLGCMLNIEGRLRRRGDTRTRVLHFAEVLAGKTDEL